MRTRRLTALILMAMAGCSSARYETAGGDVASATRMADAIMRVEDGTAIGTVHLMESAEGGVRVLGELRGLTPGFHGLHIHEVGRCIAPTFTSAGGHFNPLGREHGLSNPDGPHAGDAANVRADSTSRMSVYVHMPELSMRPGPRNLFDEDGSAIVIHAEPDDQRTNPSGNSGSRIACGVIVAVGPPPGP